jgi:hypothetical protein
LSFNIADPSTLVPILVLKIETDVIIAETDMENRSFEEKRPK